MASLTAKYMAVCTFNDSAESPLLPISGTLNDTQGEAQTEITDFITNWHTAGEAETFYYDVKRVYIHTEDS